MIVGEMPWYVSYISMARVLGFLSWIETELFPVVPQKRNFCHYILNEGIFHEAHLFCYFRKTWKMHLIIIASYLNAYMVLS